MAVRSSGRVAGLCTAMCPQCHHHGARQPPPPPTPPAQCMQATTTTKLGAADDNGSNNIRRHARAQSDCASIVLHSRACLRLATTHGTCEQTTSAAAATMTTVTTAAATTTEHDRWCTYSRCADCICLPMNIKPNNKAHTHTHDKKTIINAELSKRMVCEYTRASLYSGKYDRRMRQNLRERREILEQLITGADGDGDWRWCVSYRHEDMATSRRADVVIWFIIIKIYAESVFFK